MTVSVGRVVNPTELEAAVNLADRIFFAGKPSVRARYPRAFALENATNLAIAKDGARVVALIAGYPAQLRLAEGIELATMAVGAVCTEAEYRGRGLAGELLSSLRDQAELSGVDLLLISGAGRLYTELGAREIGHLFETHVEFDGSAIASPTYERHEHPSPTVVLAAWRAHEQAAVRFVRTPAEFASLMEGHLSPLDGETSVLLTVPDQPGYAVVRTSYEGNDRVGSLIEYAGDSCVMLACALAEARAQGCDRFFTRHTSPQSTDPAARTVEIAITGTMLVVSPLSVLCAVGAYLSRDGGIVARAVDVDGQYELYLGNDLVFRGPGEDIAPYFWGSGGAAPNASPPLVPSFRTDNLNFL